MKKYVILCAALIVTVLLMLSTAAADPLTREEIEARIAGGGTITEAERMEILNSRFKNGIPTDKNVGPGFYVSAGSGNPRIILTSFNVNIKDPNDQPVITHEVTLENSFMEIGEDAVLIQEKSENWFAEGGTLTLSDSCEIYGKAPLQEGTPVLILETNGDIHGYYAGAGTDSSTFVPGEKINIYRCIKSVRFKTDYGPTYSLPPMSYRWLNGTFNLPWGKLTFHLDIDVDFYLYETVIHINDNSIEIAYPGVEVDLDGYSSISGMTIKLTTISGDVAYVFSFDASTEIFLDGYGEGSTVFDMNLKEGYRVDVDLIADYFPTIDNPGWNHDANFDIKSSDQLGEFYIAYGWGSSASFVGMIGVELSWKSGIVLEGKNYQNHEYPEDPDRNYWHECDDWQCVNGNAHWRFGPASVDAFFGSWSKELFKISDPIDEDPFTHYYSSKTFGDSSVTSLCPHRGSRLNVEVISNSGKKIPDATVSYKPTSIHYSGADEKTTDADGKALLYAPKGKIDITVTAKSSKDPSIVVTQTRSFEKTDDEQDYRFELDIPVKHVFFRHPLPDFPSDWPVDIAFEPFFSEEVDLPDTVPELSGRQFTGWNTAEDGSGTSYAPGTKLTLSDDLTLWAQWQIAGDDWYVIYNANGGTKAPGPQIVRKGQDAVLTTELPEGGKLIFKGWALSPDASAAEYQPGDTLKYDSGKAYVVLYALWSLSPVPQPIHISFEANGEETAKLPADIWCEQGTWIQLEEAVAPIGGKHHFLGWSEDPNAKEPEYLADTAYYFFRNTQLFAVWENLASMTLTFRDPLPDEASGMPDPITILPSMSRYVRIPSQIPQKSGRVFTGWNTMQDGSGTAYNSGSVITLWTDTVLWAQWKTAENDWFIVYDANGGAKAPGPQLVPKGQDAVLTTELPESESLTFKGWATDPDAVTAEYQPGAALRYDSSKNVVVLYALWELDPAKRPVTISFSSNGGRPDTLPKKITVPKGVWVRLPGKQPSWDDQHDFLGWSADPQKSGTQWNPGDMMLPEKDTILYAMWNAHYQVIEGAGSVWVKGSGKKQRFVADGALLYFNELKVDGQPFVDGVQISSGSTIADIGASAMEKLSVGIHTVTFVYMDGQASATFFVQSKIPPTGDTNRPALWSLLILIGVAGLALQGAMTYKVKRKKQ